MGLTHRAISRTMLEGTAQVLRRGGWKAGLWCADTPSGRVIVKDLRNSNTLYRWTIGRLLLRHEARMYAAMQDCDFVPRLHGWLDRDAFAIESVTATNLGRFKKPLLTPDFYDRLQQCVNQMHDRGMVHLDLRSRRNILVRSDGRLTLIDFGNAMYFGRSRLARQTAVALLGSIDNSAVQKFRHKDFPETMSAGERVRYRLYRCWRVLWPWGRLWRAMGVNRWLKTQNVAAANAIEHAPAATLSRQSPAT